MGSVKGGVVGNIESAGGVCFGSLWVSMPGFTLLPCMVLGFVPCCDVDVEDCFFLPENGFRLVTSIQSPISAWFCTTMVGFSVVCASCCTSAFMGRIFEGHEAALCPMQPHSTHREDMPSYWIRWSNSPILIFGISGWSKSICMHNLAYLPRTLSEVRASIFSTCPSWFPIRRRSPVS
jgi:hypothetical protein